MRAFLREEETDKRYSSWKKEHMRGIPKDRRKQIGGIPVERGTHKRHSKREEETDRRYSSWKKEHMQGIPKERRKQIGDIQVGRRNTWEAAQKRGGNR
jgi:hypothetical protein